MTIFALIAVLMFKVWVGERTCSTAPQSFLKFRFWAQKMEAVLLDLLQQARVAGSTTLLSFITGRHLEGQVRDWLSLHQFSPSKSKSNPNCDHPCSRGRLPPPPTLTPSWTRSSVTFACTSSGTPPWHLSLIVSSKTTIWGENSEDLIFIGLHAELRSQQGSLDFCCHW